MTATDKFLRKSVNLGPGAFFKHIPMWRLRAVKQLLRYDGVPFRIRYIAPGMFDAPKWLASHFNVYIDGTKGLKR